MCESVRFCSTPFVPRQILLQCYTATRLRRVAYTCCAACHFDTVAQDSCHFFDRSASMCCAASHRGQWIVLCAARPPARHRKFTTVCQLPSRRLVGRAPMRMVGFGRPKSILSSARKNSSTCSGTRLRLRTSLRSWAFCPRLLLDS